jgi:hypothetical protein
VRKPLLGELWLSFSHGKPRESYLPVPGLATPASDIADVQPLPSMRSPKHFSNVFGHVHWMSLANFYRV